MDGVASTPNSAKRKPDEELRNSDTKRKPTPKNTRRRTSCNDSTGAMPSEEAPAKGQQEMFDDLKAFIVARTDSSTEKVMSLFGKVNCQVEKNSAAIQEMQKTIERIEAKNELPRQASSLSDGRIAAGGSSSLADKYSFARRSLRLWPVPGGSDTEVRREALRFIHSKLLVPETACSDSKVVRVRRTRQPRRKNANVNNEVLITFDDRLTRDDVASHGRNLAGYVNDRGVATAGMRMNYPDHLSEDFRVLEWYGAEMRRMHKEGTKRNIKFNDDVSGLCVDVKLPTDEEWYRVTPEMARDLKKKRAAGEHDRIRRTLENPGQQGRVSSLLRQPVLSGANSVPILSQGYNSQPSQSASRTVTHDPDEVIYISPVKRSL